MSYDDTPVGVHAGGFGSSASGTQSFTGSGEMWWDEDYPITQGGTISEIMGTFDLDATIIDQRIIFLSESGGTYTVEQAVDITSTVKNAGSFSEFTFTNPINISDSNPVVVQAGWFIATWQLLAGAGGAKGPSRTVAGLRNKPLTTVGQVLEGQTFTSPASATTNRQHSLTVKIKENSYITTDNSSVATETNTINLAPYIGGATSVLTKVNYIMFESIVVPQSDDLVISFRYTHATTGVDTEFDAFTIDFVTNNRIDFGANNLSLTGDASDNVDIHCYHDTIANTFSVMYVNNETGQGAEGTADIKHELVATHTGLPSGVTINRINISQGTGNSATIARIVNCRKPVIGVVDSFIRSGQNLTRIGDEFLTAFSQNHFIINGGISANQLATTAVSGHTKGIQRWDEQLSSYTDYILCIVNGACTNDVGNIGSDTVEAAGMTRVLLGHIAKMAGDAGRDDSDVVISNMIALYNQDPVEDIVRKDLNTMLQNFCAEANIPFADIASFDHEVGGSHPIVAEEPAIAAVITGAYENNTVPSVVGSGGRYGEGRY